MSCIGCRGKNAGSNCARCNAAYCSRPCQLAHWSQHKTRCFRTADLAAMMSAGIMEKIKTTVSAFAHSYPDHDIVVNFCETVRDWTAGIHMAHLEIGAESSQRNIILKWFDHELIWTPKLAASTGVIAESSVTVTFES